MNSPPDSQLEATCPYCRATILIPADRAEEEVRCKKCAEKVPIMLLNLRASSARQIVSQTNTADTAAAETEERRKEPAPAAPPAEVRVICRLCGTIVYAPVADVGKEVQCPDCESMNVIPPPPKPKKKVEIQLEEEDTFRLHEGVDQLDPNSEASRQRWYMATCPTCFTQFRLTVDHAGNEVDCPDCLTKFTAPQPPPEPKQRPTVLLDDSYELKLSDPVDRPPVDVEDLIGSKQMPKGSELKAASTRGDLNTREKLTSLYGLVKGEEQEPADDPPEPESPAADIRGARPAGRGKQQGGKQRPEADATVEKPAAKESPREQEADETRPDEESADHGNAERPEGDGGKTSFAAKARRFFRLSAQSMFLRKLLTTRLSTTLSDGGVVGLTIVIAISTAITLYVGAWTIDMMQKPVENPMQAFMLAVQSGFFGLMIMLSLVLAANTMLPIVISSSLELDGVENWPPFSPGDWVFQMFYIVNTLAIGALPTVLFVPFLPLPTLVILQLLTVVPVFPIAILSMLDEGSPFGPYAPGLWSLITVHKGLWLRFTGIGYLMASLGVAAGALVIYTGSFLLAVLAGALISVLFVIYSRFLGRMAMFMSDQSVVQESLDEYDDEP